MIKELLMSSNYWVLNKSIVKQFGIETAFILSNLAEADELFSDDEGWFHQTSEKLQEITGLSNHKQTKAINKLIENGCLYQKNKGVPMKRYFKIDYETIQKLVFKKFENLDSKNLNSSIEKNSKVDFKKFETSKEHTNKQRKSKEHNINIVDKINSLNTSEKVKEKMIEWYNYKKKELKKPLKTVRSFESMLKNLGKDFIDEQHLIDSIEFSMSKEYQGVYPAKINNFKPTKKETTSERMLREMRESEMRVVNE